VTTLPVTINPGTIAMLYFKRWTIEKTFNNTKSNFKETKAWSSNKYSLENQMRLTAMSYNLMRVFEEVSKIPQDSVKSCNHAISESNVGLQDLVQFLLQAFLNFDDNVRSSLNAEGLPIEASPRSRFEPCALGIAAL
jgi:hypothetical protein